MNTLGFTFVNPMLTQGLFPALILDDPLQLWRGSLAGVMIPTILEQRLLDTYPTSNSQTEVEFSLESRDRPPFPQLQT